MTPPRLGDEDVTPNLIGGDGVGRDTKQAIKVIAEHIHNTGEWDAVPTGEHRNMYVDLKRKHDRIKLWAIAGPVVAAATVGLSVWLGDAVWSKAKTQVTSDVTKDLGALKTQVTTLNTSVETLTADVGELKTTGEAHSKLLKRMARKLKVDE